MAAPMIDQLIAKIELMPPLPRLVLELNDLDEKDAARFDELVAARADLAAAALAVFNRQYYSYPDPIATLAQAVPLLGFQTVQDTLLILLLVGHFNPPKQVKLDRTRFWTHALACADACRLFADEVGDFSAAELRMLHLGAILHDVGIFILAGAFPDETQTMLDACRKGLSHSRAEQEILGGLTHEIAGRTATELWAQPAFLVEMIAWHHDPAGYSGSSYRRMIDLLHTAHFSTELAGIGKYTESGVSPFQATALAGIGIDQDAQKALTHRLLGEKPRIEERAALILNPPGNEPAAARPRKASGKPGR